MKLNNNVLLIGGAAIAAGAYMIYTKSKEKKDQLSDELDAAKKAAADAELKAAAAKQAAINAKKESLNSLENPNSYASKVAKVQLYLGVKPDGIVGKNTISALVTMMGSKFDTINSSNVDAILTEINARRKSASDLSQQTTTNTAKAGLIKYAKDFVNVANASTNYAELMKDHNAPLYAYDTFKKIYFPMGESKMFYKGNKFGKKVGVELVAKGDDGYVFIRTYSGGLYLVDPKYFTVKAY
jgi:hypothetical protein